MHFLIYVSSATALLTTPQLTQILAIARERNTVAQVTGMLLYKDGNFMQVLEGEEATVKKLFQSISSDPRHKGVIVLLEGSCAERAFPDWSMAFRDLNAPELADLAGYNEFLNAPLSANEFAAAPDRARKLLLSFKKSM